MPFSILVYVLCIGYVASQCPPFSRPANAKIFLASSREGRYVAGRLLRGIEPLNEFCVVECNNGYKLKGRSFSTGVYKCRNNPNCDEIPVCEPALDIENCSYPESQCNHFCLSTPEGYSCSCLDGYRLITATKCFDIDECRRGTSGCSHKCHNTEGAYYCSCREGYRLIKDYQLIGPYNLLINGKKCEDIDECQIDNFGCSHKCVNTPGSAHCSCPIGFQLREDNKTCTDIDECRIERYNRCSHICQNTPGGYRCSCPEGYWLIQGRNCEGCPKNSYKVDKEIRCLKCPPNSYTNSEGKTAIGDCLCYPGFEGDASQNIPCTDIDECEIDSFGCSHTCVNTPGSAHCSCPIGFQLREDNKTCIDVDECSFTNGGCEGTCHNTIGSFSCSCPEGYSISETDNFSCLDTDECSQNNGMCSQNCVNFPGGYYCSCNEGYRSDNSGKNCIRIVCEPILQPRDATIACKLPVKDGKRNIVKDAVTYPENSKCIFNCKKGFKATVPSSGITCIDGQWIGTIPQCISSQCPPFPKIAHGKVLPESCILGRTTVKQRCVLTCKSGYTLKGRRHYICKNNLQWNFDEVPICQPVIGAPHITCHQDIIENLPIGNSSVWLTIPAPVSNVEYRILEPESMKIRELTEFPAGKTEIKFITINRTTDGINDTCVTTVNIIDSEPPVITGCPAPIHMETDTDGAVVTWEEPDVTDNVGVHIITKTQVPNTTLMPGKHIVEYIAFDEVGNSARCTFYINVTRTSCGDPIGPINGEASCLQMFNGKICEPVCDHGYMRHPDEDESFYVCTPNGQWKPTNLISDCLEYYPQPPSGCLEFFESRILNETGEAICMKCPSSWSWSTDAHRCEDSSLTTTEADWDIVRDDNEKEISIDNHDNDYYANETNDYSDGQINVLQ